jgi:Zn-dependent M28 family amino/carboxypeptidase
MEQLRAAGLTVEEQTFRAGTPRGPMQFRNIVGRTHSSNQHKVIVIGSHYDTKWLPDIRFVGANDGGSSCGVLLELARVAAREPDLCFAFFDGEEAVREYGLEDGLWGSKFFVESLKGEGKVGAVAAMILLDMVGDRNFRVTMPANSTGRLVEQVFGVATLLGWRERFAYSRGELLDDHVPFLTAGIPAVDIIDFEYGSGPGRNDYWHTAQDTLDKLSPRSLEVAGKVTLRLVERLRPSGVN